MDLCQTTDCKSNLNSNIGQAEWYSLLVFRDIGNSLNTFTGCADENYFPNTAAVTLTSPQLLSPSTYLRIPWYIIERLFVFLLNSSPERI